MEKTVYLIPSYIMLLIRNILYLFFGHPEVGLKIRTKNKVRSVNEILNDPAIPGRTKQEIMELFGKETLCRTFTDRWTYCVKQTPHKKYYLVFYFEHEKLIHVRYKYKIRL